MAEHQFLLVYVCGVIADSTIEARVVHLQDKKKTIASHVSTCMVMYSHIVNEYVLCMYVCVNIPISFLSI